MRSLFLALMLTLSSVAALAQDKANPELARAQVEAVAGDALFQLAQKRAEVVQLQQLIETLKHKCGDACLDQPAK
jgi:hypothetical protein